MIIFRLIHVAANGIILFFFISEQYSIVYMYRLFFICSSVDGHLGYLHVLAIVNSASMNIGMFVSFWIRVLSGYLSRSGIVGSYGNYFNILRNVYTVFHSRCTNSHFHQQYRRVPEGMEIALEEKCYPNIYHHLSPLPQLSTTVYSVKFLLAVFLWIL